MSASAILISTLLVVLFVLSVALVTGSLALLAGIRADGESRGNLTNALKLLDRQWQIERLVYRHHRLFGIIVLAAGTLCLWRLTGTELAALLQGHFPGSILLWILLVAQALNLLIGLVILLRPSLLKPVEKASNRWHDLDVSGETRPGAAHVTAVLLALVGLAVLLGSATLLFQQIAPFFG